MKKKPKAAKAMKMPAAAKVKEMPMPEKKKTRHGSQTMRYK